ncbi:wax ester/triacylglycerol synthase domain-containing protein [Nonomuraea sp. NPDC049480]|uniref:wax ester/triacylglycerol synthase domain-containing protein n=1 Tax=Nonomuraea sp. NPDC049480 TaxID=3364353 RepID=UPI0037973554
MDGEFTAGAVPLTFGDHYVSRLSAGVADDSHMHLGVAVRLPGSPPVPDDLHRLIAETVRTRAPALAYRLTGQGRRARWEPDPAFDPAYHIEYHRLPRGEDVHQAVMEAMRIRPLSRERPLWSLMLLHGHADEAHILCYRAHHVFQDGMGAVGALRALLGAETLPVPSAGIGSVAPSGGARRALADLRRLAGAPPRWFATCASGTSDRRLHVVSLDSASFRDISRVTGASVAQIGITLVAGALRSWNPRPWARRGDFVIALPVGLRGHRQHAGLGNHTGLLPVALPCGEPSAMIRLRRILDQTTIRRIGLARQAAREMYGVSPALAVPALRFLSPLFRKGSARGFNVTTVPWPMTASSATEVFAIPPLAPGVAGMIAFVPAGPTVSFSGVFDARVSRSEQLLDLLRQELTELHALATR